ncbi:unnamed protein product [Rotaria sp. Silwood1]|nr:unnamed protein product [Rotaria sp. Silwood1]CAF1318370.1 unnamed protein product [Rotaria sp. Silwood1]CAF3520879.1 unnamed protein product [Rotaria sp. Silwood1]CAF4960238.1 unnamed protein product [Rotaria sp. Silwood1]
MIIINPIACISMKEYGSTVDENSESLKPIENLDDDRNNLDVKQEDKQDTSDDYDDHEDMNLYDIQRNIIGANQQQRFKIDYRYKDLELLSD